MSIVFFDGHVSKYATKGFSEQGFDGVFGGEISLQRQ